MLPIQFWSHGLQTGVLGDWLQKILVKLLLRTWLKIVGSCLAIERVPLDFLHTWPNTVTKLLLDTIYHMSSPVAYLSLICLEMLNVERYYCGICSIINCEITKGTVGVWIIILTLRFHCDFSRGTKWEENCQWGYP